jgi:Protein of unknown function (DUF3108)
MRGPAGAAAARIAFVAAVAAGLLAAAEAATAPTAAGDRIAMRYELYGFAGLHLMTNRTTLELAPGRYTITMDLETRGVAGVVTTLKSHSEVHGWLVDGRAYPQEFSGDVQRDGADYRARVDYRRGGAVVAATTATVPEPRVLVSAAQRHGTVDQLTAYFMLERQLARRGSCALSVPVFDGRLRYDLQFRDAKHQPAPAAGGGGTAPTRICDMVRREIAGFPPDGGSGEGASSGRIWYAPLVPGEVMLAVRMEFATEFGAVRGHLAALHTRGADLSLKE